MIKTSTNTQNHGSRPSCFKSLYVQR